MGGRAGKVTVRPLFPPVVIVFFWLVNGLFTFSGERWFGCFILDGLGILGLIGGLSFLVNYLLNLLISVGG